MRRAVTMGSWWHRTWGLQGGDKSSFLVDEFRELCKRSFDIVFHFSFLSFLLLFLIFPLGLVEAKIFFFFIFWTYHVLPLKTWHQRTIFIYIHKIYITASVCFWCCPAMQAVWRTRVFEWVWRTVRLDQRSNSHTRPLSELGFCLHFNHNQQL